VWEHLVMITNGPAATIEEIMTIPFDRPRDRHPIMEVPQYYDLRN
jgi:bicarbonate transport system ATP-binding protein